MCDNESDDCESIFMKNTRELDPSVTDAIGWDNLLNVAKAARDVADGRILDSDVSYIDKCKLFPNVTMTDEQLEKFISDWRTLEREGRLRIPVLYGGVQDVKFIPFKDEEIRDDNTD